MEWTDLKRLDELLLDEGASIEKIGDSGDNRPLYGVTVGDKSAHWVIVAIAGMHATEVVAPLALVDLINQLVRKPPERVRYHFVPIADPDLLAQNAEQLYEPITLPKLLNLKSVRDLEGNFTSNRYPECRAIRQWLEKLPRIDAFFSLHTAPVSPGLFFYVAGSSRDCIASVADRLAACCPSLIPLLKSDPTGVSQQAVFPGFFPIPTAAQMNSYDQRDRSGTSIEFVARKFQPSFIGVSEMPLGVCTALHNSPLEEIERFNQELAQTGKANLVYQELPLQTQIDLLHAFVQAPEQYLLRN